MPIRIGIEGAHGGASYSSKAGLEAHATIRDSK
jgi:hypothetical protein